MNRAWPSFWQPNHVQYGAGPYPLYWPETRSVARFLYERTALHELGLEEAALALRSGPRVCKRRKSTPCVRT